MTQLQEHTATKDVKAMGPYLVSENPPHYLSAVELADMPEMVRILNIDKEVYNGTASFQYPYLESHARARIERAIGYHASKGINTHWAMRTSPQGPIMGWIHTYFHEDTEHQISPRTGAPLKVADIGYWVSPEYVGKGYAGRSARYVVQEILFKEFDCDVVKGEAYTSNIASRKILQASGMKPEFDFRMSFIPKLQQERETCGYVAYRDSMVEEAVTKAPAK
ncbi:hypothetical protein BGZ93_003891 [Podila epicladia]|nr:hypothetical protein BGZ92_001888 [Podila epicladia]KAG0096846.1 hypothetical protein BGZ93_003891 [Podila epicladia]